MISRFPKFRSPAYTVINFTDHDITIEIHTCSEKVYRQLMKNGFEPVIENNVEAIFHVPIAAFRLPKRTSRVKFEHMVNMRDELARKRLEKKRA